MLSPVSSAAPAAVADQLPTPTTATDSTSALESSLEAAVAATGAAVTAAGDSAACPQDTNKCKWHAIEAVNTLSFKGGYLTKPESVISKGFWVTGTYIRFVYISKKTDWMARMAGGSLKRSGKVLDELRDKYPLTDRVLEAEDPNTSIDGAAGDPNAADDPMMQLDAGLDDISQAQTPTVTPKKKRGRKNAATPSATPQKNARGKVVTVTMPTHSPSAHPTKTDTTKVQIVITGQTGKGQLWIAEHNVYWLIPYLADEVAAGCVAFDAAVAGSLGAPGQSAVVGPSPSVANCTLPCLCIRLKPHQGNMDEYEALFVGGPLKGKMLTSKVSTMTQSKWDQCRATAMRWQCPGPRLDAAEPSDVARAVAHFLELAMAKMWMHHTGQDTNAVEDPIEWVISSDLPKD